MQIVNKQRWDAAIKKEDAGWQFEDKNLYSRHEQGNLHGQIVTYAKYMDLFKDFSMPNTELDKFNYSTKIFDLQGKTIVDIAGGPSSLLLRCKNFKKAYLVDPGNFPDYIVERYKENDIEVVKLPAEEFRYPEVVDETWYYNALAHFFNPYQILLQSKNNSKIIRLIEGIECGTDDQHPQNLTAKEFEDVLEVKGTVVEPNEPSPSPRGLHFVGVFQCVVDGDL